MELIASWEMEIRSESGREVLGFYRGAEVNVVPGLRNSVARKTHPPRRWHAQVLGGNKGEEEGKNVDKKNVSTGRRGHF